MAARLALIRRAGGHGESLVLNSFPIAVELNRDPLAGGLPHGSVSFSDNLHGLGAWKIEALDENTEATAEELRFTTDDHFRLKPDVVQDLIVVCRYILETPEEP